MKASLALVAALALVLLSSSCAPVPARACTTSVDCGGAQCVLQKDGARLCEGAPPRRAVAGASAPSTTLSLSTRPSFNPIAARGRTLALAGSLSVTPRSPR